MSVETDEEGCVLGHVSRFDMFGFAVFKDGTVQAEDDERCHDFSDSSTLTKDRTWKRILSSLDKDNVCMSPQYVRLAIKHGVPKEVRGDLWNKLLDASAIKANITFSYQTTLNEIRSLLVDLGVSEYGGRNCIQQLGQVIGKLNITSNDSDDSPESLQKRTSAKSEIHQKLSILRQIMLDLDRSFPTHRLFMDGTTQGKEGRASLFRVLAVYSQYNKSVSYCQGMSYIAGMLLMNMEEEKAFWCLVSLFERPKYLMGYFDNSLSKIQRHSLVFEALMKQRKHNLHKHLEKHGIDPLIYLTPWFMALFTSLPCWDTVLFIWDLIILEGVSVIFQVALSILEVLSDSLMKSNEMCHCLPILLHPPARLIKRSSLVPVILRIKVQKWEIESIQDVLHEEEENTNAKKRRINSNKENTPSFKRFKQQSNDAKQGSSVPVFHEPPIINRFVDYITGPLKNAIFGNDEAPSNQDKEIEMVTFSSRSHQSPPVNIGVCCSTGRTPLTSNLPLEDKRNINTNSPFSPGAMRRKSRRHHHAVKALGSPIRRSPRLLAKQRMQAFNASTSSLVGNSAKNQHSFRTFYTRTPLRPTQFQFNAKNHRITSTSPLSSESSGFSPEMPFTPDIELMEISQADKKLDFDVV